jgi:FkbM family methyltransferase
MIREISYRDNIPTKVNVINPDEHLQGFWDFGEFYEPAMLDYIYENYQKDLVYFDIGACIGNHTLFFLNYMKPKMVYSFEPVPEIYERLIENVKLNGKENIRLCNFALGAEDGKFSIKRSDFGENIGMSSINGEGDFEVDVRSLDSFVEEAGIKEIDLMKIDIEGRNIDFLLGARKTLMEMSPDVFIESIEDCLKVNLVLEAFGYFYAGETFNFSPTHLYKKK